MINILLRLKTISTIACAAKKTSIFNIKLCEKKKIIYLIFKGPKSQPSKFKNEYKKKKGIAGHIFR